MRVIPAALLILVLSVNFCLPTIFASQGREQPHDQVPIDWSGYHDYEDLTRILLVMNDMAWELSRADSGGFHGLVGEKIVYAVPQGLADATSIALKAPAYPAQDVQFLQLRGEGSERVVSHAAADQAGLYEMEFTLADRTRRTVFFSRQVNPEEGKLAKNNAELVAKIVRIAKDLGRDIASPVEAREILGITKLNL